MPIYFESSILPMEAWDWEKSSKGVAFKNAAHRYQICVMKERKGPAIRRCPGCKTNTVRPPEQFCDACKATRIVAAKRASKRNLSFKRV